jgi:serine protease Do
LQQGDLHPGLLGAQFRPADPFVRPTVERTGWRSPAALAGVERGDRIAAVNDRPVDRLNDVRQVLGNKYAGDRVRLQFDRGGRRVDAEVQLVAALPKYQWPMLGVIAEAADGGLRATRVVAGSPAAEAGLAPGHILLRIDDAAAASLEAARGALDRRALKESMRIAWREGEQTREATLPLGAFPDPPDPPASPSGEAEAAEDAGREEVRFGSTVVRGRLPKNGGRPGLVVYFAGARSPAAEGVASDWKRLCDERDLALLVLSPKSGGVWRAGDVAAAGETLKQAVKEWRVDARRVVLHGAGETASVAVAAARANRDLARGVLLVGAAGAPRHPGSGRPTRVKSSRSHGLSTRATCGARRSRRRRGRCATSATRSYGARRHEPSGTACPGRGSGRRRRGSTFWARFDHGLLAILAAMTFSSSASKSPNCKFLWMTLWFASNRTR